MLYVGYFFRWEMTEQAFTNIKLTAILVGPVIFQFHDSYPHCFGLFGCTEKLVFLRDSPCLPA
jgi:hypothetical protein